MTRRKFLVDLAGLAVASLAWDRLALADTRSFDFSPQQQGKLRAPKNPAAQRVASGYHFITPGALTVAVAPFAAPLATYATDASTIVGSDPDYAQLLADALGLKLVLVPVAWPDWPLGLASGKYDAVISNVGVTEQRKQKFDFTTYRLGLHGFYVAATSSIQSIRAPKDIAGLRIITGSGTLQERILLEWNQQNVAQRLKPAELQFFDDLSSAELALQSGRADAIFNPHAPLSYSAATQGKIRLVGTVNAGWPLKADVAVASRKGSGLAPALTEATNGLIAGGQYKAALARWGLEDEAIQRSETNPPGYKDA
jgi:polar amino acid transport system substrate-binding protein